MIRWTRTVTLAAAIVTALALAAPAGAATYRVAGKQKVIDADAGTYRMSGGLIGKWATTSFNETATEPYYAATGTEEFKGCIDRRRDRSCAGDPAGTLRFDFQYWGLYGSADPASLVWGACFHPVTGGTGDFKGARGVLTFVDSPAAGGVKTAYVGSITTVGGKAARRAARAAAAETRGC